MKEICGHNTAVVKHAGQTNVCSDHFLKSSHTNICPAALTTSCSTTVEYSFSELKFQLPCNVGAVAFRVSSVMDKGSMAASV